MSFVLIYACVFGIFDAIANGILFLFSSPIFHYWYIEIQVIFIC